MKQNITPEQLNELSEEAKIRLREWWKPQEGDCFIDTETSGDPEFLVGYDGMWHWADSGSVDDFTTINNKDKECFPLLSIGQMIEFLFDSDFSPTIISDDTAFYWSVEPQKHQLIWKKELYESSELVDALWKAVKECLENA